MKTIPYIAILFLLVIGPFISSGQNKPNTSPYPVGQNIAPLPGAYPADMPVSFVKSWSPVAPYKFEADVMVEGRTADEIAIATSFYDGLGRVIQTVNRQASPKNAAGKSYDIVAPAIYDVFGRETYRYLPYTSASDNGLFKTNPFSDQAGYMSQKYPGEQVFYTKTDFEASPLGRPDITYLAGNSWAGSNIGKGQSYQAGEADEVVIWNIEMQAGSIPTAAGYYAAGALRRNILSDEHGKRVIEYKDKEGLTILKKIEIASGGAAVSAHEGWLCTYYVYDMLNNLRFVIQPKGTELLQAAGWNFNATQWNNSDLAKEFCFIYEFDAKNRLSLKRNPGAEEITMVYDARNRLVLYQDGNLRHASTPQWLVTTFDGLNRPTRTLLWNNNSSATDHQTAAWNSTSYPDLAGATIDVLTVTHYDNYDWVTSQGGGLSASFESAEISSGFFTPSETTAPYASMVAASNNSLGQITGTQTKVLGTTGFLWSINLYDSKGRLIQVKSKNNTGGTDVVTTQYSFNGKVLVKKLNHQAVGTTPGNIVLLTINTYDHAGRLMAVSKKINGAETVTIVRNSYDDIGQLSEKKIGQKKPGGVYIDDPIETLHYDYNVNGALTGINKDYSTTLTGGHYFGEKLSYDHGFINPQYNGNIAGVVWASANDQQPRAYGYSYDAAGRLLKADFTEQNSGNWNTSLGRDYTTIMGDGSTAAAAYDANGNIRAMKHFVTPNTMIDDLTYDYTYIKPGNKAWSITDAQNNAGSTLGDFREITSGQTQDYSYDYNGNLTSDQNKGISSIDYNHLNLPVLVTFAGKGTIAYTYDANGIKQKKVVTDATNNNTVTTTTYINGFEYENADLKQFGHEEGRIRRKPDGSFAYDYFIKDHLGSVRVTLTEEEVAQEYRMASMELDSAQQEEPYYDHLAQTRSLKPSAYPDRNDNNRYVARLDGKVNKIGPSILLKVMAGDKISLQVKSWYKRNHKKTQLPLRSLGEQAASLAGLDQPGLLSHGQGIAQNAAASTLMPALLTILKSRETAEISKPSLSPKAYVSWILLDENLKPFQEDTTNKFLQRKEYNGFQQVGREEELKQHVKAGWEIAKSGYVYIFTSNESEEAEVFFEDFGIQSVQGPLLEVNHTYPFGLTLAGISTKAFGRLQNRLQFNGKERQREEFSDGSGLEWLDFGARMYGAQTGRWHNVDPLANKYEGVSPYAAMGNNPVSKVDPDGKRQINFDQDGNYISTKKDNWWHNFWHGSQGRIVDKNGDVTQKFTFADPKNDVADIQSGKINKVEFVQEKDISEMMAKAGVFDPDNKIQNSGDRYGYIMREGRGGGRFDFSYTAIPDMYKGASRDPLRTPSPMIFLVDGVAHNHMNFGNFLYGAAGTGLGLSVPELLAGAHYNSIANSNTNGYLPQFDSKDDQYSIRKGAEHGYENYYKERIRYGSVKIGAPEISLPISIF